MIKSISFTKTHPYRWYLAVGCIILLASCGEEKIDFNTQVRPILNKNCISCHGGVKQSGGFGLIFRENALGETKNGKIGIVPGNPDKSEMISRINHENKEMRMPLERDPLKPEEIEIITKWIEQGAEWQEHWAYIKPEEPEVPAIEDADWAKNEIDHFIYEKLENHGLTPSERASKEDLVRRLYLDLIGLPPTLDQVDAFVNDNSANGFEKVVDQLLASPQYGEHWASMWLDLARYADSKGYEADRGRQIWKYRDWVIKAFNQNMSFDQFTIEQLAGDLLPNPTIDNLVATAFHRNTLNNGEGGTDNEEYRISSVIDRVNNTWEVWQSTTMGCVQCHSHPYDPIRHEEYYTSMAFFNNTSDWDVPTEHPVLRELKKEDEKKLDEIKEWIINKSSDEIGNKWERFVRIGEPKFRPEDFDEVENVVHYNRSGQDYMQVHKGSWVKIKNVSLKNIDRIYFNYRQKSKEDGNEGVLIIRIDSLNGTVIGKTPLVKTNSFTSLPIAISGETTLADVYFQFDSKSKDYYCEIDGFLFGEKLPGEMTVEYQDIYAGIDELLNAPVENTTPIMVEKQAAHSRSTNVFVRGNWMVKADQVSADIPKLLNYEDKEFEDRLDLAKWLVSDQNPLTGRVMVNRFWAKLFGRGIVLTVEDFGTLGDYPSHPELLDWLALKFSNEWDWDMKKLLKTIVTSATYQQTAVISQAAQEKDPGNKWLSRSPRFRLSAEQIRDQALAVSGLLSDKMYGPSVMPHQPDGVWTVPYSNEVWKTSENEDAYRRGLYTYIRRSTPYPSFITFDAASREFCLSRRINTNTPLQALVLLNDPVYIEAARNLAKQILPIVGDKKVKVETAYRKIMGKLPDPSITEILIKLLNNSEEYYSENLEEAKEMAKSDSLELASLTVMANALMNMDEFIVKN